MLNASGNIENKKEDDSALRDYVIDAIRFWEPRRIGYNIVLPVIVILCFVSKLSASKQEVSVNLVLFILSWLCLPRLLIAPRTPWTSLFRLLAIENTGERYAGDCSEWESHSPEYL